MKKMTAINIDKWRKLNETLFKAYIDSYGKLSFDSSLDAHKTLLSSFEKFGISGKLNENGYGSAYTIARELGIYYEIDNTYFLSNMAISYTEGNLSYTDFLKHYCLNIEFVINEEVIHPFFEILNILKSNGYEQIEIAKRTNKLVPDVKIQSSVVCLGYFLDRCVEANILKIEGKKYYLNYDYSILLNSLNRSKCSVDEFVRKFINGESKKCQENIVKLLLDRKINILDSNNMDIINDFADWFIDRDGSQHNYFSNYMKSKRENLLEKLKEYEREYEKCFNEKVFSFEMSSLDLHIRNLKQNLLENNSSFIKYSSRINNHMPRAILGKNNLINFLENYSDITTKDTTVQQDPFQISVFKKSCDVAHLKYSDKLIIRYAASLMTKPFVLLTGLSGSGKTQIAKSFAKWICEDDTQYCIVPVGADWTNREPLLGYVNALNNKEYILPENGALELLINANKEENENKPYFLILDEMNLSHVERYFADFLSVMESGDKFKLHSSKGDLNEKSNLLNVPKERSWPKNLFVVGTVNIDETTYMFSPKVLDRANVIEFRVDSDDLNKYLIPSTIKAVNISNDGKKMAKSFIDMSSKKIRSYNGDLISALEDFFNDLQKIGAEFGYRTASEVQVLFNNISDILKLTSEISMDNDEIIDIAIMQKLLPKLHGSRKKLVAPLSILANKCLKNEQENVFNDDGNYIIDDDNTIKYKLSFEKISRMYKNLIYNGFTSYAEA